jgi:hypothetical protein
MPPDGIHQRPPRCWWILPVVTGISLITIAFWGITVHRTALPRAGPAPVLGPARQSPATSARVAHGRPRTGQPAAVEPLMPAVLPIGAQSVIIPSLHVRATARSEPVRHGALGVPTDPAQVGWWMPSTAELVLDGHVDSAANGPGALFEVRTLRPGAAVLIQTASGTEHWRVDGVRTYRKGHVPAGLFRGRGPRLVIVTCGGPFDYATRHYYDNVIAYASPAHPG